MSFLWGKRSSDTDSSSRTKHVADLVACFPSIRRPNNDDSSFEFSFEIDHKLNTLRVCLPSDFPSNKPVLQMVGPVLHPWLDQYKRVSGCDKLTYWNKKSSSLREVVEETLSELRKGSGGSQRPQAQQQQTLRHSYTTPSQQYHQQGQQQQYPPQHQPQQHQQYQQQMYQQQPQQQPQQQQQQYHQQQAQFQQRVPINSRPSPDHLPPPHASKSSSSDRDRDRDREERPSSDRFQISLPGVPSEFPELQALQVSQLERLLQDEVAIMSHAASMECVDTLRTMRDDMCKSNADDAKRNLRKRGNVSSEEEEILIMQNTLRAAADSYKLKLAQSQGKHAMSKESVVSQLSSELTALDNTSEDLAQDFVNGGQDVNSFLQEYLKARGQYHSLKVSLKAAA